MWTIGCVLTPLLNEGRAMEKLLLSRWGLFFGVLLLLVPDLSFFCFFVFTMSGTQSLSVLLSPEPSYPVPGVYFFLSCPLSSSTPKTCPLSSLTLCCDKLFTRLEVLFLSPSNRLCWGPSDISVGEWRRQHYVVSNASDSLCLGVTPLVLSLWVWSSHIEDGKLALGQLHWKALEVKGTLCLHWRWSHLEHEGH